MGQAMTRTRDTRWRGTHVGANGRHAMTWTRDTRGRGTREGADGRPSTVEAAHSARDAGSRRGERDPLAGEQVGGVERGAEDPVDDGDDDTDRAADDAGERHAAVARESLARLLDAQRPEHRSGDAGEQAERGAADCQDD